MQCIEKVSSYEYQACAGSSIWSAIQELLQIHRTHDVVLVFNGYKIKVYPNSCEEDLCEKYDMQLRLPQITK